MALTQYERVVAESIKEQGGTESDFREWLGDYRKSQPIQEAPTQEVVKQEPISQQDNPLAPTKSILAMIGEKKQEIDNESDEGLKGFASETGESLKQRGENLKEIVQRSGDRVREGGLEKIGQVSKEKGLLAGLGESMKQQALNVGSAVQTAGQLVAGAGDIAWEGVENLIQEVTPEKAEQVLQNTVSKIGDTAAVQALAESYGEFREKNPESARNIEGVLNIAQILPVTKGGRAAIGTATKETIKAPVKIPAKTTSAIIRKITPEGAARAAAGIDDIAAREIKNTSKKTLKETLDVAKAAVDDIRNPTPFEKAGDKATQALDTINVQKNIAAKTKADALKGVANKTIETKPLKDKFSDLIGDRFNVEIVDGKIVEKAGQVASISDADIKDLQKFYNDFKVIDTKSDISLGNLDALVDRMQSGIKRTQLDRPGGNPTAVEKTLNGFIEGKINATLKKEAGEKFVQANKQFRDKLNISLELEKLLGVEGNKAGSLFKSLFSPQTGARARNLFKKVQNETNIDLSKEGVLAKFAMEAVGDTRGLGLLESVTEGATTGIINPGMIQKALQTIYTPEKVAKSIAKKKTVKEAIGQIGNKIKK